MTRVVVAVMLAAVAAAAGGSGGTGGAAGAPARTVVLDVRWSRFSPETVSVRAGDTVRFVVRNHDPIRHELIVGDEEVQDRHERGTEAHHGDRPGEVSVRAGGRAETIYTFTSPGRLLFGCHLPGHWAYGMRGTITVT